MADDLGHYIRSGAFDVNPYLFKRVEDLEKTVESLKEEIKTLREMVDAMWYKPAGVNMPGFNQIIADAPASAEEKKDFRESPFCNNQDSLYFRH